VSFKRVRPERVRFVGGRRRRCWIAANPTATTKRASPARALSVKVTTASAGRVRCPLSMTDARIRRCARVERIQRAGSPRVPESCTAPARQPFLRRCRANCYWHRTLGDSASKLPPESGALAAASSPLALASRPKTPESGTPRRFSAPIDTRPVEPESPAVGRHRHRSCNAANWR